MQDNSYRRYAPSNESSGASVQETDTGIRIEDVRVFMLPFAGANVNSYKTIQIALEKENIRTTALELPGHGARGPEPLLSDIEAMESDLYQRIEPHTGEPFVLFGHSMGSLLAYRLAHRLIHEKKPPVCMIVSGRAAPSVPLRRKRLHALPQQDFFEEVRKLGGMPEAILQSTELMEYFAPILRSDFKAVETYQHTAEPALPIPVSVILGEDDTVTREDAECWDELVLGNIRLIMVAGAHFYLLEQPERTAHIIRDSIRTSL